MKNLIVISIILVAVVSGCKKEETTVNDAGKGSVKIIFEHKWGPTMAPFELNTWYTHPQTGDSLRFNNIKYYVTNIKLKKSDGTWWTESDSYRLIDGVQDNGQMATITDIPAGEYTEIQWMLGVDSTRNISGIQSGALDPSLGMFWTWQSGYIFIKAEGFAPAAPQGNFQYHLGGFSNPFNAIQIRNFNIASSPLRIKKDANSTMTIKANMARFWHGGVKVEDTHTIHMPSEMAKQMAANFAEGFIVGSIINP